MSLVRKKAATSRPQQAARRKDGAKVNRDAMAWIGPLAAPYLQGYKAVRVNDGILNGFWFCAPGVSASTRASVRKSSVPPIRGQSAGFFVGFIESADEFSFLGVQSPECVVFAWIYPTTGLLHRRLVHAKGSLVRTTFEYIRWLTHRPPRFVFHDKELPAMTRHHSMRDWPAAKRGHLSHNFFIETMAWLVRSGLVRKLREEIS